MRNERNAIRALTGLTLMIAFGLPALLAAPTALPSVALGSRWILYFEQALILLVVLLLASTIFVRGVLRGQVPTSASREGFEWSDELVSTTDEIAVALQTQIDTLNDDVRLIVEFLRESRR